MREFQNRMQAWTAAVAQSTAEPDTVHPPWGQLFPRDSPITAEASDCHLHRIAMSFSLP